MLATKATLADSVFKNSDHQKIESIVIGDTQDRFFYTLFTKKRFLSPTWKWGTTV